MEKRNLCCEEKDQSWWKIWVKRQKHKIISSLGKKGREKICWAGRWKIHRLLAADRPPIMRWFNRNHWPSGCWRYVGQEGRKYDDQMIRKILQVYGEVHVCCVRVYGYIRLRAEVTVTASQITPQHLKLCLTFATNAFLKHATPRFHLNKKDEAGSVTRI